MHPATMVLIPTYKWIMILSTFSPVDNWSFLCVLSSSICSILCWMFIRMFFLLLLWKSSSYPGYVLWIFFFSLGLTIHVLNGIFDEHAIIIIDILEIYFQLKMYFYILSCLSIKATRPAGLTLPPSFYRCRSWGLEVKLLIHTTSS